MFYGLAIGGNKGNGKDFIMEYLRATRPEHEVVRCKTPIVQRYERIVGHPYEKPRDDAELILISATQIRKGPSGNDSICKDYLIDVVPDVIEAGKLVFIPDMRRIPENEACHDHLSLMCLYVWASEETRKRRILARDGNLDSYKPDDDTEKEVESLQYHYVVDNDRDDDGRFAFQQLESYLARCGTRFRRRSKMIPGGARVRLIDPGSGRYFDTATVLGVEIDDHNARYAVKYDDEPRVILEDSADLLVIADAMKGAA